MCASLGGFQPLLLGTCYARLRAVLFLLQTSRYWRGCSGAVSLGPIPLCLRAHVISQSWLAKACKLSTPPPHRNRNQDNAGSSPPGSAKWEVERCIARHVLYQDLNPLLESLGCGWECQLHYCITVLKIELSAHMQHVGISQLMPAWTICWYLQHGSYHELMLLTSTALNMLHWIVEQCFNASNVPTAHSDVYKSFCTGVPEVGDRCSTSLHLSLGVHTCTLSTAGQAGVLQIAAGLQSLAGLAPSHVDCLPYSKLSDAFFCRIAILGLGLQTKLEVLLKHDEHDAM